MRLSSLPLLTSFLLLFEADLQAQSLTEIYQKQQHLRSKTEEICRAQFIKAQYLPLEESQKDIRYIISAKGVQGIKDAVAPTESGESYKCDRGDYERPMLLGRTYSFSRKGSFLSAAARSTCRSLIASGAVHPSECVSVSTRKVRLELESCAVDLPESPLEEVRARLEDRPVRTITLETSCLVKYEQFNAGLVGKSYLAFRRLPPAE